MSTASSSAGAAVVVVVSSTTVVEVVSSTIVVVVVDSSTTTSASSLTSVSLAALGVIGRSMATITSNPSSASSTGLVVFVRDIPCPVLPVSYLARAARGPLKGGMREGP